MGTNVLYSCSERTMMPEYEVTRCNIAFYCAIWRPDFTFITEIKGDRSKETAKIPTRCVQCSRQFKYECSGPRTAGSKRTLTAYRVVTRVLIILAPT